MKTVMGIINLQEDENMLQEIAAKRPLGAVPFAGRYRLIDFSLSSMVNSGIKNVGILLPNKSRAILDHLRSGKDWDLARKHDGLFYLPTSEAEIAGRTGDIQSFYRHLDFIEHSSQRYVLVSGSQLVYNMNFENALRFHQNTSADITIIYHIPEADVADGGTVLQTTENGLVSDLAIHPKVAAGAKASLGVYLMDKRILIDLVKGCFARGGTDFLIDALMKLGGRYSLYGYQHEGFVAKINSVTGYYNASMDILRPEVWRQLFLNNGLIYTKVKDEAPVKYKRDAKIINSVIANGCVIEGTVENSIIFRGVKIEKGVHVKNSIIMQKCELEEDVLLENVICDKNVVITKGKWLKGAPNYPVVVEKGIVI